MTEFHIKDAQYLVTPMTKMPQGMTPPHPSLPSSPFIVYVDLVGRILQELVNYKKLNLQNLVLFLDDQLQRIEFPPNLAFVNDATLKVIARLSKNIVRYASSPRSPLLCLSLAPLTCLPLQLSLISCGLAKP